MGRKAVGPVCCVIYIQQPVHLSKREGVRPGVPGLIGSILRHSNTVLYVKEFGFNLENTEC